MNDAFIPGPRCHVSGATEGLLSGMNFVVKDLINVANVPTGGGNPDWPRYYPTPEIHAWVVQRLLDTGASVIEDDYRRGVAGDPGGKCA